MTKVEFMKMYDEIVEARNETAIVVAVQMPNLKSVEMIINPRENFEVKRAYYDKAYDENMCLKSFSEIKIVDILPDFSDYHEYMVDSFKFFQEEVMSDDE